MTIQINYIQDTATIAVKVNDECNHAGGTHTDTIERYASSFNDGNVYPDFYEQPVEVCNGCNMYFDEDMGYWEGIE